MNTKLEIIFESQLTKEQIDNLTNKIMNFADDNGLLVYVGDLEEECNEQTAEQ